ncbi:DUF2513 domain-containing protein [Defluviitalea raffinosedens]|uniref:DUF2513 domain-containing protein n=1 Tax=Defluviitalea raffinosedens TaxID=1450156 RepID=A0A7C8HFE7_9FIRM|nr:DUF2513 domain-containing protein [Defluviitalea raffinosedens]KAE9633744.1 DUF2513 domain-containing protein [Defluviitalea raffinosedens]
MKRNFDLIRHILLKIEESDSERMTIDDFVTDEYSPKEISFHIRLLLDVNYIEATSIRTLGSPFEEFIVQRITMFGYEYLDSVRDPKIWTETKAKLQKATSSVSLEIVKSVATKIISGMLGI